LIILSAYSYAKSSLCETTITNFSFDIFFSISRTFLLFSLNGQTELAEKYLDLFTEKSGIERRGIQRWIPIVAAVQLKKGGAENREFLEKWIDVVDYE